MTRRFDDEEVALILSEATLVESVSGSMRGGLGPGDGLTLDELKEVAAEAGIDPKRVELAARALVARPEQSPFRFFLGTDSRVRVRADFEGVLDDRVLGEALQEIRSLAPLHGTLNALPGGIEWTGQDEWGTRSVSVSTTSAGTRLDVTGDFDNAARAAAGGAAVAAGVGAVGAAAAVAAVGPVGWALVPVVAASSIGISRLVAGRYVKREVDRLRQLGNRLHSFIVDRAGAPDRERG